jgi:hypothetical protein
MDQWKPNACLTDWRIEKNEVEMKVKSLNNLGMANVPEDIWIIQGQTIMFWHPTLFFPPMHIRIRLLTDTGKQECRWLPNTLAFGDRSALGLSQTIWQKECTVTFGKSNNQIEVTKN